MKSTNNSTKKITGELSTRTKTVLVVLKLSPRLLSVNAQSKHSVLLFLKVPFTSYLIVLHCLKRNIVQKKHEGFIEGQDIDCILIFLTDNQNNKWYEKNSSVTGEENITYHDKFSIGNCIPVGFTFILRIIDTNMFLVQQVLA